MAKRSTKMGEKKVHSKKRSPLKEILATCLKGLAKTMDST